MNPKRVLCGGICAAVMAAGIAFMVGVWMPSCLSVEIVGVRLGWTRAPLVVGGDIRVVVFELRCSGFLSRYDAGTNPRGDIWVGGSHWNVPLRFAGGMEVESIEELPHVRSQSVELEIWLPVSEDGSEQLEIVGRSALVEALKMRDVSLRVRLTQMLRVASASNRLDISTFADEASRLLRDGW